MSRFFTNRYSYVSVCQRMGSLFKNIGPVVKVVKISPKIMNPLTRIKIFMGIFWVERKCENLNLEECNITCSKNPSIEFILSDLRFVEVRTFKFGRNECNFMLEFNIDKSKDKTEYGELIRELALHFKFKNHAKKYVIRYSNLCFMDGSKFMNYFHCIRNVHKNPRTFGSDRFNVLQKSIMDFQDTYSTVDPMDLSQRDAHLLTNIGALEFERLTAYSHSFLDRKSLKSDEVKQLNLDETNLRNRIIVIPKNFDLIVSEIDKHNHILKKEGKKYRIERHKAVIFFYALLSDFKINISTEIYTKRDILRRLFKAILYQNDNSLAGIYSSHSFRKGNRTTKNMVKVSGNYAVFGIRIIDKIIEEAFSDENKSDELGGGVEGQVKRMVKSYYTKLHQDSGTFEYFLNYVINLKRKEINSFKHHGKIKDFSSVSQNVFYSILMQSLSDLFTENTSLFENWVIRNYTPHLKIELKSDPRLPQNKVLSLFFDVLYDDMLVMLSLDKDDSVDSYSIRRRRKVTQRTEDEKKMEEMLFSHDKDAETILIRRLLEACRLCDHFIFFIREFMMKKYSELYESIELKFRPLILRLLRFCYKNGTCLNRVYCMLRIGLINRTISVMDLSLYDKKVRIEVIDGLIILLQLCRDGFFREKEEDEDEEEEEDKTRRKRSWRKLFSNIMEILYRKQNVEIIVTSLSRKSVHNLLNVFCCSDNLGLLQISSMKTPLIESGVCDTVSEVNEVGLDLLVKYSEFKGITKPFYLLSSLYQTFPMLVSSRRKGTPSQHFPQTDFIKIASNSLRFSNCGWYEFGPHNNVKGDNNGRFSDGVISNVQNEIRKVCYSHYPDILSGLLCLLYLPVSFLVKKYGPIYRFILQSLYNQNRIKISSRSATLEQLTSFTEMEFSSLTSEERLVALSENRMYNTCCRELYRRFEGRDLWNYLNSIRNLLEIIDCNVLFVVDDEKDVLGRSIVKPAYFCETFLSLEQNEKRKKNDEEEILKLFVRIISKDGKSIRNGFTRMFLILLFGVEAIKEVESAKKDVIWFEVIFSKNVLRWYLSQKEYQRIMLRLNSSKTEKKKKNIMLRNPFGLEQIVRELYHKRMKNLLMKFSCFQTRLKREREQRKKTM